MSKKQLPVSALVNELEGSSFFPASSTAPSPGSAPASLDSPPNQINQPEESARPIGAERTDAPSVIGNNAPLIQRSNEETNERTLERSKQRNNVATKEPTNDRSNEERFDRWNELTNARTNVTTNQPSRQRNNLGMNKRGKERQKIRHTFDIFADQLISLREIAIEQEILFGERVLLGDLVQQALDTFIANERSK